MKKIIATMILMLAISATAMAQQPRVYLMDRAKAVEVFNAGNSIPADFLLFSEGVTTRGKIAVTIENTGDPLQVRNALIISLGIVFEQPPFTGCLQIHKGEQCTGDARSGIR